MRPSDRERLNAHHRDAYDAVAARFAAVNAAMPAAVLAAARAFLAAVTDRAGCEALVLDLGCGHGRDIAWFEAQGLRAAGADLSPGMLAEARGLVRAPLVQADMRRVPFAAGTFHGVWCNAAILHLPKAEVPATLAQIRCVLAPGGLFDVAVQVGEGEAWEAQSYERPVARFYARYASAEFRAMLEGAGFEVLDEDENDGVPGRHWAHFLTRSGHERD